MQSFFIEVKNGGVTYKNPETGGWWYEEYPNPDPNDRVLNGFIFALLGVHEYYERTGNKDAKYLFDKGIIELKNHLSDYDTGEWTYYDQVGNIASIGYHSLHVNKWHNYMKLHTILFLRNITKNGRVMKITHC
jgi:heparosan-N-sulfate-glucuronate 5-epimerase